MKPAGGVAALERLEALIANPALYELAELVPEQDPSSGGRRRQYPVYMWLLYDALLSVYGSARQVEVEFAHPLVWKHLRSLVRRRFPRREEPERQAEQGVVEIRDERTIRPSHGVPKQ